MTTNGDIDYSQHPSIANDRITLYVKKGNAFPTRKTFTSLLSAILNTPTSRTLYVHPYIQPLNLFILIYLKFIKSDSSSNLNCQHRKTAHPP